MILGFHFRIYFFAFLFCTYSHKKPLLLPILADLIRISGFRGIRDFEISLPRIAVLIGPNNCGKTSVLKAMQLALGDYGRYLSDEDFHIDDKDKRSKEIVVDVRIVSTNTEGSRIPIFETEWLNEFGDKIQADIEGNQFFAFRTIAKPQTAKPGYLIERFGLIEWVLFSEWTSVIPQLNQKNILPFGLDPIYFYRCSA